MLPRGRSRPSIWQAGNDRRVEPYSGRHRKPPDCRRGVSRSRALRMAWANATNCSAHRERHSQNEPWKDKRVLRLTPASAITSALIRTWSSRTTSMAGTLEHRSLRRQQDGVEQNQGCEKRVGEGVKKRSIPQLAQVGFGQENQAPQRLHRNSTGLSTDHYPWCIALSETTRYSGWVDKTTGKKKPPGAVTQGGFWQGPETGGICPQLTFRKCERTKPALCWQVMGLLYRMCACHFQKGPTNGLLRPQTYWRAVHVQPSR